MKEDENKFMLNIYHDKSGMFIRDIIALSGINHKRAWYILAKWTEKGWYDYGVNIELGWLTDSGKRMADHLCSEKYGR